MDALNDVVKVKDREIERLTSEVNTLRSQLTDLRAALFAECDTADLRTACSYGNFERARSGLDWWDSIKKIIIAGGLSEEYTTHLKERMQK